MWMRLMLGVTLSLLCSGLLEAQPLYTCKTPEGRLVIRDTACPAGSTEKIREPQEVEPSPPPSPPPPSQQPRRASRRPQTARPAPLPAPVDLEPEVPLDACVNMNDVATEVVSRNARRQDLKWKVDVSNRCKRPLQAIVVFGVYDRNEFEIRATRRKIRVPARDSTTAQGTMSLPLSDFKRISSKKAEVYLP